MENTNARQIAAMTSKLDHISQVMDELRSLPATLAAIQSDQQHMASWQRQVNAMTQSHSTMIHSMDKRITVLERWHKFMLSMPAIALAVLLAVGGYARGYIETVGQFERNVLQRLTAIEATINHYSAEQTRRQVITEGSK